MQDNFYSCSFSKIPNYFEKLMLFFQEMSNIDEYQSKYTYSFKFKLKENGKMSTILKLEDIEQKMFYSIDIQENTKVCDEKAFLIGEFIIITYKLENNPKIMLFILKSGHYHKYDGVLLGILDKKYIFTNIKFENETYHVIDSENFTMYHISHILKFNFERDTVKMERDFLSFLINRLILLKLEEKYLVNLLPIRNGPYLNENIKVFFLDECVESGYDRLYFLDSEYIDEQLDNGNEVYFPTFKSKNVFEKFKFLHFIDSKNGNEWLSSINKYISHQN